MNRNADDMGAVDPGMRDAERSIDAVGEGEYDTSRSEVTTATTDHDEIRRWAEDRHATPATVAGTGDAIGDLRFDFDFGPELVELRPVSWEEWLKAFDERGLEFVHHADTRPDGSVSYDFFLEPRRTGV